MRKLIIIIIIALTSSIVAQSQFEDNQKYFNVIIIMHSGEVFKFQSLIKEDSIVTCTRWLKTETFQLSSIESLKVKSKKGRVLGGGVGAILAQIYVNSITRKKYHINWGEDNKYSRSYYNAKATMGQKIIYPIMGISAGIIIGNLLLSDRVLIYSSQ